MLAGKVTLGLVLHWPCITDNSSISIRLTAIKEMWAPRLCSFGVWHTLPTLPVQVNHSFKSDTSQLLWAIMSVPSCIHGFNSGLTSAHLGSLVLYTSSICITCRWDSFFMVSPVLSVPSCFSRYLDISALDVSATGQFALVHFGPWTFQPKPKTFRPHLVVSATAWYKQSHIP